MPEIEGRCIFDEEDERVLLCQILVPLAPKIYKEIDRRCYSSKKRGEKGGVESEVMEGLVKKEGDRRKGGRGRCKRGDVGRRKKKRGMMRTRKRY